MLPNGFHDVPPGKLAMVVTHLEIHTPQLRGLTCPDGVSFEALPRDLSIYRDLFRRIGKDWLWFGRLVLDDDALNHILHDPKVALYTLIKNGKPEALLELDFRKTGECELAYLGVTAPLIGTGAGSYLMDQAQRLAFERPIKRLHVHTCTLDSPQALQFYVRSGFTATRRQVEVADDPRVIGVHHKQAAPQTPIL